MQSRKTGFVPRQIEIINTYIWTSPQNTQITKRETSHNSLLAQDEIQAKA